MRVSWTSLAEADAFAQASQNRSWFRVDDLLTLVAVLQEYTELDPAQRAGCQVNPASTVK